MQKKLIDGAVFTGCDAVKFQKRTPELLYQEINGILCDTPWGRISYIEYRIKMEFGFSEYEQIDSYCKYKGIDWFVSAWDEEAVEFTEQFDPILYKVSSASLTDFDLMQK